MRCDWKKKHVARLLTGTSYKTASGWGLTDECRRYGMVLTRLARSEFFEQIGSRALAAEDLASSRESVGNKIAEHQQL